MIKKAIIFLLAISLLVIATNKTYAASGALNGPDVVIVSNTKGYTIDDVLSLYDAGESKVSVLTNDFTGNANVVGDYPVTITADGLGITKKITVRVKSGIDDRIYAAGIVSNRYTLYVPKEIDKKTNILSETDIIKIASQVGAATTSLSTRYYTSTSTYFENENSVGKYSFETKLSDPDGHIQNLILNIEVIDLQAQKLNALYDSGKTITYIVIGVIAVGAVVFFVKKKR